MSEVDEVLQEFIIESNENLDELDRSFVALEANPGDRQRIGAIFRAIHTIKGTSGFLGCGRLESLAHAGEEVLSLVRDNKLSLTPHVTTELLAMVDGVRAILRRLETTGEEGTEDFADLVVKLRAIAGKGDAHPEAAHAAVAAPPAVEAASAPVVDSAPVAAAVVAPVAQAAPTAPAAPVVAAKEDHGPEAPGDTHEAASVVDGTVRVDVGLLDRLMNLVGELVLARNQIVQVGANGDSAFVSASQRLNLITSELQEGVMKTRMRPIGSVWNKYPRIVRDLSLLCAERACASRWSAPRPKSIARSSTRSKIRSFTCFATPSTTESNPQEARVAKGKNPTGVLALRAYHEGGKVNIELTDDGHGIDPERVRAKALERGIVSAERAKAMSDREVVNLVFAPGFSTADKVSNISGRGRRNGRREDEHRAHRWNGGAHEPCGAWHHDQGENPAHARDHSLRSS